MTQLFDLNARIQQLTWSLIFYEKYYTSLSTIVLVVFTTANFGGFSNFCRYYTRSQTGKSTGYRPTLKPLPFQKFVFFSSKSHEEKFIKYKCDKYVWPIVSHHLSFGKIEQICKIIACIFSVVYICIIFFHFRWYQH